MSNQIPTLSDGLRVDALLEKCRYVDDDVTSDKIQRWSQRGLLLAWDRHGRGGGQGRGSVVVWPRDTIERVAIIAPIMRTGKNADIVAALALLRHGFIVRGKLLRRVLSWYLGRLDKWFTLRNYPHGESDIAYKKQWVVQALRRRVATLPDDVSNVIATLFVAANDSLVESDTIPDDADSLYRAAHCLSPGTLRRALDALPDGVVGDAAIERAWSTTTTIEAALGLLLPRFITMLSDALALTPPITSTRRDMSPGVLDLDDVSVTALRLFVTLGLIAATHNDNATMLPIVTAALDEQFSTACKRLGLDLSIIDQALSTDGVEGA